MPRILAIVAGVVAILVAGVLGYAATKPDTFRVERALDINAPAEKVFPLLVDLRRSIEWSPYEKKDPDMKRTYGGPATGKGAIYEWDGDSNVGAGRIEIAEVSAPEKVTLKLDMVRPFMAHNIVEYTLAPNGDGTKVTWAMHGPNPYMAKIMQVFFDVDRMVGKDFEEGLANLKAYVENQAGG